MPTSPEPPVATTTRSLDDILAELRDRSLDARMQGDLFEALILHVLRESPVYTGQYTNVTLWRDYAERHNRMDTGVDLVATRVDTGEKVAIQCKFYDEDHYLPKAAVDSFLAAVGHKEFAEGILISTTDHWSREAEKSLQDFDKPITRIRVQKLRECGIDWASFNLLAPDTPLALTARKTLRPHQRAAIDAVVDGFMAHDRGQLIMACGTGKTFTSLKLVEEYVPHGGTVLFLVPSISLLQQTLMEWKRETSRPMRAYAVCSDQTVGRRRKTDSDDVPAYQLAIPATTNAERLLTGFRATPAEDLTVVFSTYQSISRVATAQATSGGAIPEFDLIICDEAHRTTGVAASDDERSEFLKVHDNAIIRGKKRLYMTATPRIYDDASTRKAEENNYVIASMDDHAIYGPELHRLGFGEAVEHGLLTDYRVLILTASDSWVEQSIRLEEVTSDNDEELRLSDAMKILGCWKGLSKQGEGADEDPDFRNDPGPMRRAVAFAQNIKTSKYTRDYFPEVVNAFIEHNDEPNPLRIEINHVDGTESVLHRSQMLDWLRAGAPDDENTCRILTNARCLSEGVDVPALDAVLFLNPRDSVVDVVQSVGRVMRLAPGKKYGYIILPIPTREGENATEALNNNRNYKVVWQVLQALRAHDDRFNAMVNKLELNKDKGTTIKIFDADDRATRTPADATADDDARRPSLQSLPGFTDAELNEWKTAIYARIVKKVGDRMYFDQWARDISVIADTHVSRMTRLLADPTRASSQAFDRFLQRLQDEINPAVSRGEAIEMLAQHLITRPIFEAIFGTSEFASKNPVSLAMQEMITALGDNPLEEERATLEKFYRSVRQRVEGIDNAEGRQTVLHDLYEKFFRNAFPQMAERLGIVYTPVEVVDYLIQSADHVLTHHFGTGLTGEGVHVLDPFTGTGTFITRLIQSGLITRDDARRKYSQELHANEMVLLAYYIAAINIELVWQEAFGGNYTPFDGIVWTDTFQLAESSQVRDETAGAQYRITEFNGSVNSERAIRQSRQDITVILGNPPYSAKQTSANDNNANLKYPGLDARIRQTYAARATAQNLNNLYDSYIRALRWATDRIGNQGVVAVVTNGSFIDGNAMDGLRAQLADDFSKIWVFNARGNQRTSGETSRQEGGKLFGSGSRAPIALTVLLKDPAHEGPGELLYHDIGDYLTREQKLAKIREFGSVATVPWQRLTPNTHHDWINQRDEGFENLPAIAADDSPIPSGYFRTRSSGIKTGRDTWTYNFSQTKLFENIQRMVDTYNHERVIIRQKGIDAEVNRNPEQIKWNHTLLEYASRNRAIESRITNIYVSQYRPFQKMACYFARELNDRTYRQHTLFPENTSVNRVIAINGLGAGNGFSTLMSSVLIDGNLMDAGAQTFPLRYKPKRVKPREGQSELPTTDEQGWQDGVSPAMQAKLREVYGDPSIDNEAAFYYVYGILHSPEYRQRFANDMKKMLPRIPFAEDFWAFSRAGRELGDLHVGYESAPPHPDVIEQLGQGRLVADGAALPDRERYRVRKMRFAGSARQPDRTTIIYNEHVRLTNIPLAAYDYVVNGKSAIEWIMERYAYTVDKESRIVNDPNEWAPENPRYIVDLLKRIVTVSLETNRIVAGLPPLRERDVRL